MISKKPAPDLIRGWASVFDMRPAISQSDPAILRPAVTSGRQCSLSSARARQRIDSAAN